MADLINNLPALDDALLTNLLDNALRLSRDGNAKQRSSAALMLAAVEAERATRAEAALAAKPKRPASRRKTAMSPEAEPD